MPKHPKSGGFVFVPRNVARSPKMFGKSSMPLEPLDSEANVDGRFRAAQLQHAIANAVRESLLARSTSLASLVSASDLPSWSSYDRLARIQRGETMMTLADLMTWASIFDEVREAISRTFETPFSEIKAAADAHEASGNDN